VFTWPPGMIAFEEVTIVTNCEGPPWTL